MTLTHFARKIVARSVGVLADNHRPNEYIIPPRPAVASVPEPRRFLTLSGGVLFHPRISVLQFDSEFIQKRTPDNTSSGVPKVGGDIQPRKSYFLPAVFFTVELPGEGSALTFDDFDSITVKSFCIESDSSGSMRDSAM